MRHSRIGPLLLMGLLLGSLPAARATAAGPGRDACTLCHLAMDRDADPGDRLFDHLADDVHLKAGLGCVDCHGGNPDAVDDADAAMSDASHFRGAPARAEIPGFCGRCHSDLQYMRRFRPQVQTDQLAQYWTSRHGQLLKQGQLKAATCIDCHGVHGIMAVDDPRAKVYPLNVPATCGRCHADPDYMAEFGIPTDQLEKYKRSVHGVALLQRKDVGSPTCNDCHGNHGATPPSVNDIAHVCGQCHVNNEELFQKSSLSRIFVDRKLGYCMGCHGKHDISKPTDALISWGKGSVCLKCHERNDQQPRRVALAISATLDSLRLAVSEAETLVHRADEKGMETSDLLFQVEAARKGLITTRTSIHSFDPRYVSSVAAKGRKAALAVSAGAHDLLRQWTFRRKGLLVAFLLTTLLIVAIFLHLRRIERPGRDDA